MTTQPPLYVINLDRSKGRLKRIASELAAAGLDFRRVAAIDGESLPCEPPSYDASANARTYLAPLSPAEIACVLSHREVWRMMLADGKAAAAIVLEDDASPVAPTGEIAELVAMVASSRRPELVKLYALRPPRPEWPGGWRIRQPLLPALTTTAQALNRPAAERLLGFTDTFWEPADVIIQRWWAHGVRVSTIDPPAFAEVDHNEESTIRRRGEKPPEGRLLRELRRPMHQARRFCTAAWARLRER